MIPSIGFVSNLIGCPDGPVCVIVNYGDFIDLELVDYISRENALLYSQGNDTPYLSLPVKRYGTLKV